MDKEKLKKIMSIEIPTDKVMLVFLFVINTFLAVGNAENAYFEGSNILPFVEWTEGDYFWKTYGTLLLLLILMFMITKRFFMSYAIVQVFSFIWGTANRVTWITRKMFITASDLKIAKEAAGVRIDLSTVCGQLWWILLIVNIVVLVFNLYGHFKGWCKIKTSKRSVLFARVAGSVCIVVMFLYVYAIKPVSTLVYQVNSAHKVGCVVWFCQSMFNGLAQSISEEEVVEIFDAFEERMAEAEEVSKNSPNIIVVMSEAFWDVDYVSEALELSENPMRDYEELTKDAIKGEVAVNVYGGGTYTTEFEFLTGLNTYYLGDAADFYGTYYAKKQESLVSYLENMGYNTMALHPYEATFWKRHIGYANMGFDEFYDVERFQNREMYHGYISDTALSQEIIDRFLEQKQREPASPVFSFSVSVQNHVNDLGKFEYDASEEDKDITVEVKSESMDEKTKTDVGEYINGLDESIEALEELIHYFETYEEDTMIIFFGDHAPLFASELLDEVQGGNETNLYRTPYMIWTNYENDFEAYGDMSISCLSSVMLDYLKFPKPRQYYVNKYLLENYPIVNRFQSIELTDEYVKDMNNVTNIAYYVYGNFPKKENAMPFWEVAD